MLFLLFHEHSLSPALGPLNLLFALPRLSVSPDTYVAHSPIFVHIISPLKFQYFTSPSKKKEKKSKYNICRHTVLIHCFRVLHQYYAESKLN